MNRCVRLWRNSNNISMYFMDLDCEITGDVLGSKEQVIRLIIKTMRALSVSEVSEVLGGNALTDC
ncbi:hypothetical protein FG476_03600 [Xylella fastidiosa subsp. multiplex]|uniref:Uncharacterized protein n=1 Tax=Xylella fastidiosa subsp. multiplex TaxID=644357 RepID=A0A9Q4MGT1_XYLFS|nr:hypothetical protein [Xylella fastidiosa subsp. multiplex]